MEGFANDTFALRFIRYGAASDDTNTGDVIIWGAYLQAV
jgi:hypothetical protein